MTTSRIGDTYAAVLFQVATNNGTLHEIIADFSDLNTIFPKSSDFKDFLTNTLIPREVKRDTIIELLKNKIKDSTFNFILLLVNQNLVKHLPDIVTSFMQITYAKAKIITFKISTANQFTGRQNRRLIKILKKLTDAREVKLVITVDPSLIGGFLVKRDSKIIDLTAKNQFKELAYFLNVPFDF